MECTRAAPVLSVHLWDWQGDCLTQVERCRHVFFLLFLFLVFCCCFFFYLDRSVERWGGRHNNEQSCQRQRKKLAAKMENVLRSKTTNRPTAFKITFEAIVHVFVARHAERKGNLVFNIMYGKFCFDGDFFVRNLDASVELRHCQSLSRRIFFFSCQSGTLSLFFGPVFFSFSPKTFFRFWFFHEQRFCKQRASTCEFCEVRDVNKIWE